MTTNKTEQRLLKKIPDLYNHAHRDPAIMETVQRIINNETITNNDWKELAHHGLHIKKNKIRIYGNSNPHQW